jgi:hypothetical protein
VNCSICTSPSIKPDLKLKNAARLTDFAVLARYPGEALPTVDDARVLLDISRSALDEILDRIDRM